MSDSQQPFRSRHEIIGTAVRVGSQVKTIKAGDRVGVGAMIGACYQCKTCKSGNENFCPNYIYTYVRYPKEHCIACGANAALLQLIQNKAYPDGVRTQGGYSTGIIANEQFVFPIPDRLASEDAASMLCAGLTVFAPLIRNGIGPGKKVGVIGIGGLVSGHGRAPAVDNLTFLRF